MDKKEEIKRIKKNKQFRKDYKKIQDQSADFKLTFDDIKINIKTDIQKRLDEYTTKIKDLYTKEASEDERKKKKNRTLKVIKFLNF